MEKKGILCNKKNEKILKPFYHFFLINESNIQGKTKIKIMLNKYKTITSYYCESKKIK